MQKKIIALAVAGLVSGAAFAQSNVTLYGTIHTGYVYSKSDYKKFQGIEDGTMGASRFGVRGEEALGNGLKAIYRFEWRVREDEGTLAYRNAGPDPRFSYVGLAGNFGSFTVGRVGTPSDDWSGSVSPMGWTGITPANTLHQRFSKGVLTGERWNNAIRYDSPNFSGLNILALYSFGEKVSASKDCGDAGNPECADTTDAGALGLGLRYANGPVTAVLLYEAKANDDSLKTANVSSNTGFGAKGWRVGGAYDFKVVKVYASYTRVKANNGGLAYGSNDVGSDKQTMWSLGLNAPVSAAGMVWFEYAQYKDSLDYGLRRDINNRDLRAGSKAKGYNIGYEHTLSKRTSLHVFVTRFDNDRGIDNAYGKTSVAGEKQNVFAAGIRHSF